MNLCVVWKATYCYVPHWDEQSEQKPQAELEPEKNLNWVSSKYQPYCHANLLGQNNATENETPLALCKGLIHQRRISQEHKQIQKVLRQLSGGLR
jgi:hypothetical protein